MTRDDNNNKRLFVASKLNYNLHSFYYVSRFPVEGPLKLDRIRIDGDRGQCRTKIPTRGSSHGNLNTLRRGETSFVIVDVDAQPSCIRDTNGALR